MASGTSLPASKRDTTGMLQPTSFPSSSWVSPRASRMSPRDVHSFSQLRPARRAERCDSVPSVLVSSACTCSGVRLGSSTSGSFPSYSSGPPSPRSEYPHWLTVDLSRDASRGSLWRLPSSPAGLPLCRLACPSLPGRFSIYEPDWMRERGVTRLQSSASEGRPPGTLPGPSERPAFRRCGGRGAFAGSRQRLLQAQYRTSTRRF